MNLQQQRFVDEYLIDCSAKDAAIRAGYSKKSARILGSALLAKPHIKAAIAAKQAVRSEEAGDRATRAAARLEAIALMDLGETPLRAVPPPLLKVVQSATVDLLKLDGKFTEQHEHKVDVEHSVSDLDLARWIAFTLTQADRKAT
jgi:phage terminase small subunit